ncbi:molybdenum cofactor guanylyltransferase [Rothia sp. ZJ1223]|uniref:molybdenum cofactor guanylyltransferase n=1 Tax=Rothia sp. ZJ1223 TaxID=2811098 RepID=UPI0019594442|nr:NTP transferase domain-containing protein [Rothia sp. ZJ1223]MBM7051865.1 NTP transferase domain-containing protein [Rothia sp. ZJ1223]
MDYNAIIVAGGRSSRLGGTPKALLSNGAVTLLDSTLLAVSSAKYKVVVGPENLPVPPEVHLTREQPVFSGPAAALAAGARVLKSTGDYAPWTAIFSVDMPHIAEAIPALLTAAAQADHQVGFMGQAGGVLQPLAGIYHTHQLVEALKGEMDNKSVRSALRTLNPEIIELPARSIDDVDTWEQARTSGFDQPTAGGDR